MQCLRIWFTIWLFAISVNSSVASPVDILNVDNKNVGVSVQFLLYFFFYFICMQWSVQWIYVADFYD